ncbi:MAG TPA: sulfate reduction electron transfer complex DsrMKJOP subunit DsrJ [Chloroflexota bacterium]|nr:sulfate reduction electron transfer complex DsrMKJOP subunit DsrJ [Chloroflexota bacterium]
MAPGLGVFFVLLVFPFWFNGASGQGGVKPDIVKPTQEKQCIESADYMRAKHMQLLIDWREEVVRNGPGQYVATDGKKYDMSLTGSCLKCHSNKTEFCDRCHDYAGVQPNCWNCHTVPPEKKT